MEIEPAPMFAGPALSGRSRYTSAVRRPAALNAGKSQILLGRDARGIDDCLCLGMLAQELLAEFVQRESLLSCGNASRNESHGHQYGGDNQRAQLMGRHAIPLKEGRQGRLELDERHPCGV